MLDNDLSTTSSTDSAAGSAGVSAPAVAAEQPTRQPAAKKAPAKKAPAKKATAKKTAAPAGETSTSDVASPEQPAKKAAAKKAPAKKAAAKTTQAPAAERSADDKPAEKPAKKASAKQAPAKKAQTAKAAQSSTDEVAPLIPAAPTSLLFVPPPVAPAQPAPRKKAAPPAQRPAAKTEQAQKSEKSEAEPVDVDDDVDDDEGVDGETAARRRRRRGGRRRRKPGTGEGGAFDEDDENAVSDEDEDAAAEDEDETDEEGGDSATTRRRRRRRRAGDTDEGGHDDPQNTVVRVRQGRSAEDEITGFSGSTRLEAKKQRRREGREAGRRRAPIISEAEFLARREAVDRAMVIRQSGDLTQIAVLEDKVLVEHYVARESQTSLIGNVYLGRVQNVLPSMEAAFIDIGRGRNAVLYAGEVNWDQFGVKDAKQRRIEAVLKSGQAVLVQVTKDPIGHKGARLTSQISLPGRFLVYVPDGTTSGISRKLPDTERNRLKDLLKEIVPDTAGVIVRTAAEGASEDELTHDVARLKARWEDIEAKSKSDNAPQLLYAEPDLTLKVVRDLFTEDFGRLVVEGEEAWEMVSDYVEHVAPELSRRLERFETDPASRKDAFASFRIDEQIAKGLERKVWLPSGGSLVIDRTEAMTVIDVNTGKFTGSGGNLEETVTKNNLEAAEEIVRQLRLRDIGGIIVVDFIDMVLESNRDLVLRRLIECLGRDRTRHQVAEVTSLGLVQMTRKRIGTGLLEAFSENCEHCQGRGVVVHHDPVESKRRTEEEPRKANRRSRGAKGGRAETPANAKAPTPADVAAIAHHHDADESADEGALNDPDLDLALDPLAVVALDPSSDEMETPLAEELPDRDDDTSVNFDTSRLEPFDESGDESRDEPLDGVAPGVDEQAEVPEVPEVPEIPAPVAPAAPTVVTSVRRTVARRPAGPPAAALAAEPGESAVEASGGVHATDESTAPEGDETSSAAPVHVPIKKKGARKR
jgi:ribonuclease E